MNAPRDPWADFAEVFAEELAAKPLTPEQMDAMHEEYVRGEIASAQSEEAQAANIRRYNP